LVVSVHPVREQFTALLAAAVQHELEMWVGAVQTPAGSQVVRIPGFQARQLGGGMSITMGLACLPLDRRGPSGRRLLPRLLLPGR
jgi:hypothetical protein